MALIKEIQTKFGVPATYWNIALLQYHKVNNSYSLYLYGYKDKQSRIENKQPLEEYHTVIIGQDVIDYMGESILSQEGKTTFSQAYDRIKNHKIIYEGPDGKERIEDSIFIDATDDL